MRLIDADELKKAMLQEVDWWENSDVWIAHNVIDNAPTIEPKRGRWVEADCSVCGYPVPTDSRLDFLSEADHHYCYNCGAKMDGNHHGD